MKQSLLIVLAIVVSALVYGQQAERQQVVLEIGTGVWCVYCPGAAMGADDLLNSGADVAVIKYHSGDMYANSFSSARLSFYGISSFPTAKFDGTLTVAGGSASSSMYGQYLARYNTRKSTPTSFELSFDATTQGNASQISINVEKVFAYTGTNLVVHFVLTETNIPHNWFNQQYVKNVARLMSPGASGTPVNFSSSNTQTVNLNFTLNPAWVKENLELIAFIQDMSTKEILQAGKIMFAEFSTPDKQEEVIVCHSHPVTFTGQGMYNTSEWFWTFPGGIPETSADQTVEVSYPAPGVYDVMLTISDGINSHTYVKKNHVTVVEWPDAPMIPAGPEVVDLYYVTSSDYETEIIPEALAYMWMLSPEDAGTLVQNDHLATVTWNHEFLGQAYLSVKITGDLCDSDFSEELEIDVTNSVGISNLSGMETISFFPNPSKGVLHFQIPADYQKDLNNIRIFDLTGKMVWQYNETTIPKSFTADLSHLQSGVYLLSYKVSGQTRSHKLNVIR